jgi:hypothetical protein
MLQRWKAVRSSIHELMSFMVFWLLEGVGYPVRDETRYTPLSRMARDGIKVFVRPVRYISIPVAL